MLNTSNRDKFQKTQKFVKGLEKPPNSRKKSRKMVKNSKIHRGIYKMRRTPINNYKFWKNLKVPKKILKIKHVDSRKFHENYRETLKFRKFLSNRKKVPKNVKSSCKVPESSRNNRNIFSKTRKIPEKNP